MKLTFYGGTGSVTGANFLNSVAVEKKSMNTVADAYEVLKICLGK